MRLHSPRRQVRRESVFEASRQELWAAVTEAERLAEWFASDVELELRRGGRGTFRWENGEERRAIVREVVDGERLELEWTDEDGIASTVELELADGPDGTRLTVTETATAGVEPAVDWSVAIGIGALARHLEPVLV